MNNYIAVGHNGSIDEFKADSDNLAKDYLNRRYGSYWHHHYKLFKGHAVREDS